MLAVVKKPHTEHTLFEVMGKFPSQVLQFLKRTFGQDVKVYDSDDDIVDIFSTRWYQEVCSQTTSGEILRIYRENCGMSQAALGEELGKVWTQQKISDLENNRLNINKEIGLKLSQIFSVPVERFLNGID